MTKSRLLFLAFFSYLLFFSISLIAQPTITQQPTNQTVPVGQTAFFSLSASSANPLFYQWYKNGVVIPGANTNNYTTPATTLGDNGTVYYCIVADSVGFVESNNATLLVGEPPVITSQPSDTEVTEGDPASFSITSAGTAPLQYQWKKNGTDVTGATTNTYNIGSVTIGENGDVYSCVVSNSFGIVISSNATLSIIAGETPVITEQPQDKSTLSGQSVTFTTAASGTEPLTYQWYKNNIQISGANSPSYTTPPTVLADNNSKFYCKVTNNFGSVDSDEAGLFVLNPSSRVTSNLQVLYEFEEGEGNTVYDVSGNGEPENITLITPEKAPWTPRGLGTFYNNVARRTATDSKLRNNVVASNEISLEVWIKPDFASQNGKRIFTYSLSGEFRNFSIIANGSNYEFRLTTTTTDLNGLPSLKSSAGSQTSDLTHLVYTRNSAGVAKIYVNGVLDVTGSVPGDLSRFKDYCYLALGAEPLGGNNWIGLHYLAAVYDRALTEFEVQHNYSIGTPVDNKPAFTIQPTDQYVVEGEAVLFDSYAVSVKPITYQWRKNGVVIPGETDRKLNLTNIGSLDNGAIFTNTATTSSGSTISNSATVYITSVDDRVSDGIKLLYTLNGGSGNIINDVSGIGAPLNMNIFSSGAVTWEKSGLRINSAPSIVTTNSATKIISPVKSSNEISLEAWISSSELNQASPTKIFTMSADDASRNISLGQNNDSYVVNLRTTSTDNNGNPEVSSSSGTVNVNGFDHVVFTRAENGTAKFYINGTERVSTTIAGNLSNWNDVYLLSLGNEFGADHHWQGLINTIAVFDRALTSSEVVRNYTFGPYGVVFQPTNLSLISNEIGVITIAWDDNSTNEQGFIIERGVGDPLVYTEIGSVGKDSILFVDDNIADNTIYTYRIKAFYSLGESEYSEQLVVQSLITPIEAPTNINASLDNDGYPIIVWDDNSSNESNFVIERRQSSAGSEFIVVDTVLSNVTSYKDFKVSAFTSYIYRVMAYNQHTSSGYSGEKFVEVLVSVDESEKIPTEFSLSQNYPNPFNPTTTIKFGLPQNSSVVLSLYNLLGQQVMKLAEKEFSAGRHNIEVRSDNLTSGIYIYSISAKGSDGSSFVESKKMILLK